MSDKTGLSPIEKKRAIERLLEEPAWRMIVSVVQEQTDAIQNEVLFAPVASVEDVYRLERKKGALEGRLSLTATVGALLENCEYEIRMADKSGAENV